MCTQLLIEFATIGIGVHHAGLSMDDRRATEQLFLKKVLRILVATSVSVVHDLRFVTHEYL
jgi:ATP-dependent DNA helicase HFM1/MER3